MQAVVQGQLSALENLADLTDIPLVKKFYKLNADPVVLKLPKARSDHAREWQLVDEIVTSSVAMKTVQA